MWLSCLRSTNGVCLRMEEEYDDDDEGHKEENKNENGKGSLGREVVSNQPINGTQNKHPRATSAEKTKSGAKKAGGRSPDKNSTSLLESAIPACLLTPQTLNSSPSIVLTPK